MQRVKAHRTRPLPNVVYSAIFCYILKSSIQVINLKSLLINSLQPVTCKTLLCAMENQGAIDVSPREMA